MYLFNYQHKNIDRFTTSNKPRRITQMIKNAYHIKNKIITVTFERHQSRLVQRSKILAALVVGVKILFWHLFKTTFYVSGSELEEFLDFVIRSSQQGISVLDNDAYEQNWSLGQSFLFTVTVVTTIGKHSAWALEVTIKLLILNKETLWGVRS